LLDWHAKHEHDVKNIIKKFEGNFFGDLKLLNVGLLEEGIAHFEGHVIF
jgi:hypothetical protein